MLGSIRTKIGRTLAANVWPMIAVLAALTLMVGGVGCTTPARTALTPRSANLDGAATPQNTYLMGPEEWSGVVSGQFSLVQSNTEQVSAATPGLFTTVSADSESTQLGSSGDLEIEMLDVDLARPGGGTLTASKITLKSSASAVRLAMVQEALAHYGTMRDMSADEREKFLRAMEAAEAITPGALDLLRTLFTGLP